MPVEAVHLMDGETEAQNVLLVFPQEVAGQWGLEAQLRGPSSCLEEAGAGTQQGCCRPHP